MKHLKKIFHTSDITHEDPYLKLHDYLLLHRATPHPTTNKCPAELLFNRNFYTTLPDIRHNPAAGREDILEARDNDGQEKEKMKQEKDSKANVRDHPIKTGDKVLLRRKTTKHNSVYEPEVYTVTGVYGTQVEAEREGTQMVRDSQKWKKVEIIRPRSYAQAVSQQHKSTYQEDPDVGAGVTQGTAQHGAGRAGQQEEGEGGQDQREAGQVPEQEGAGIHQDRPDIRAALRRHPDIIVASGRGPRV